MAFILFVVNALVGFLIFSKTKFNNYPTNKFRLYRERIKEISNMGSVELKITNLFLTISQSARALKLFGSSFNNKVIN